jgi:uncharacterized protein YndB with AHSA1/START domain
MATVANASDGPSTAAHQEAGGSRAAGGNAAPAEGTSRATTVTLPADDQILITREFDAPRHLVFRAWTTPEFVMRWWPGRQGRMTVTDIDLRVGGGWRYVLEAPGGFEVAFHGEYREIVPNERLVSTEVFEGAPPEASGAGDVLNIVTLTEVDGRTRLELLVQCPNQEVRDQILGSGMEKGLLQQMEILDEIVASLR